MKKGALWPWVIGAGLALHVIVSLVVVAIATTDSSYGVEENYYQKAVNWDQKRAQDRTNAKLGWALNFEVAPPQRPGEQPTIEVHLADNAGEPFSDATVNLETFHKARSDDVIRMGINAAEEPGLYTARPAMRHNGLWELRFTVDHDGNRFTYTETRHLFVEGTW